MRPLREFQRLVCLTTLAILVMLMLVRAVHGQEANTASSETPPFRILISDVRLRRSTELALRLASARVAASGCRGMLSEFVDERGQPLAARLETLRLSLRDYLHAVYFVDGRRLRSCSGPVAVTMPGSRVVYLCDGLTRQGTSETWVTVIHEVLHSLGLAENPPTPAFISHRVRTHCW